MRRFACVILAIAAGCGYTTRGLYPDCIQTVAVPVFSNDGFRRDIEFLLTEKVIQTIESETPYKVVDGEHADTELNGAIVGFYKRPFGEDPFDNPRGGLMALRVRVSWLDKRTGNVLHEGTFEMDDPVTLDGTQPFLINMTQSITTADAGACERLARDIVTLMQTPW